MTDASLAAAGPLRGARTLLAAAMPAAASSVSRGDLTAIVVKLLNDAGLVLDTDRQAAKLCIMRASALLRATDDLRAGDTSLARGAVARGGLAPWQTRRVLAYIEANLGARIRLHELAGIARLSTGHFARAFKASIGESVGAHVARRRIVWAQEMMLTTNDSLSQIALTCGLSDQSRLCRRFRAVVGTTPTAWRRQWFGSAGEADLLWTDACPVFADKWRPPSGETRDHVTNPLGPRSREGHCDGLRPHLQRCAQ